MKKVAVLGAGLVAKPAVDYFSDRCGYALIVTSLEKSEALRLVRGKPNTSAMAWSLDRLDRLDRLVGEVDLVLSMIPPFMHLPVAEACIKHKTNMVTTSYISPQMAALDRVCRKNGILILNEIGEDPGLDIMSTKRLIDQVHAQDGRVTGVISYGAGLPAFAHNTNPMGYKFSWSPRGVVLAANTPAAYLDKGRVVEVSAAQLFANPRMVDIQGLGRFEAYPNRDCRAYLDCFDLTREVSFFRGILRHSGWCKTMKALGDLHLLDASDDHDFIGITYAAFTAGLIGADGMANIVNRTARFLRVGADSDLIQKLKWLGFFSNRPIDLPRGTNADLLVHMMVRKMSYTPLETDMVIVHSEITAQFPSHEEKRISTLAANGEPGGDSAMSKAVSLPAAIASRLILEKKITTIGVQRPTPKAIYAPVLDEMDELGYRFEDMIIQSHIS